MQFRPSNSMSADVEGDGDFVELLFKEVQAEGVDCPSAQMLVEMAKSSDYDTVADALGCVSLLTAAMLQSCRGCLACWKAHSNAVRGSLQACKQASDHVISPGSIAITSKSALATAPLCHNPHRYITEMGCPDKAAELLRRIMQQVKAAGGAAGGPAGGGGAAAAAAAPPGGRGPGGSGKSELDYTVAAKVLNRCAKSMRSGCSDVLEIRCSSSAHHVHHICCTRRSGVRPDILPHA